MKKALTLVLAVGACLLLDACHKTCTCYGYDGLEHYYSSDEVDDLADGNCLKMRNFPFVDHYSVCHW